MTNEKLYEEALQKIAASDPMQRAYTARDIAVAALRAAAEPTDDAPTDLRWCIKADAQACEEIAIGDEPLSQKQIDELAERARRLIANLAHYRRQLNREGDA